MGLILEDLNRGDSIKVQSQSTKDKIRKRCSDVGIGIERKFRRRILLFRMWLFNKFNVDNSYRRLWVCLSVTRLVSCC